MREIDVEAEPLELLARILTPERAQRLAAYAEVARATFGDRTIWHASATAQGGGVAEMLQTLLAYGRGAGIENRWLVLDGDPAFFAITKRIHNRLHGSAGDSGDLGDAEHAHYERVLASNLDHMLALVDRRDIVLLHDPQAAGLVDGLRSAGLQVVWRCHVGRDTSNDLTDEAWSFLRPYLERADAFVFSRAAYVPPWIEPDRVVIIPPSIDPFSAKNRDLDPATVDVVLAKTGLVQDLVVDGPVRFVRRDGSEGTLQRRVELVDGGSPPPRDARVILQVSRWDRLKDMAGVLAAFVQTHASASDDVHLMLVGPDVSGVTDDPEGAEVLAECWEAWRRAPSRVRSRVHLVSVPMDDVDENAIIVNALQRSAYSVVQKSLVEGFGLTVAEAMWKARPVVASRVGGIQDQIVDGQSGLLLDDPYDLDAAGSAMARLLDDAVLAERLGTGGRASVHEQYLGDRHLSQYTDLFARLST